jgi:omega-6 fatty acid desaturase (delta-12 desaturase)
MTTTEGCTPGLRKQLAPFEAPIIKTSIVQVATTLLLFIGACVAMYWSIRLGWWAPLLLSAPTGGLLVRVFIIQHDCGHGSMFRTRRFNDWVGTACSLMTLAPYANWRRQHAGHHANWNNLDRRESGADIYSACMTVAEYRALPRMRRFFYRALRHPVIANLLIPPVVFILLYRVPFDTPRSMRRERWLVYGTNLALAAELALLSWAVGFRQVLLVQVPVMAIAAIAGVWLFSLQHRFEGALWAPQSEWTLQGAALRGSSYLRLPRALQWFTGNIGFHHIHHLSPRMPNYRLAACHRAIAALQTVKTLRIGEGLAATRLALWDEAQEKLVSFAAASRLGRSNP